MENNNALEVVITRRIERGSWGSEMEREETADRSADKTHLDDGKEALNGKPPSYSEISQRHKEDSAVAIPSDLNIVGAKDDSNAVEIHVEENEVTESQHQLISLWQSPSRATQDIAQSTSACLVGFEPLPVNTSDNEAAFSGGEGTHINPKVTEIDLLDCLPHPSAFLHPETMQWDLVVALQDKASPERIESQEQANGSTQRLWRIEATLKKVEFLSYLLPNGESDSEFEGPLLHWVSTKGEDVICPVGKVNSVIPIQILEAFKLQRLQNPRVGVSGSIHLQEAASTLIRIVGNAANGETRGLSASGKLISLKLGLDKHSFDILNTLGFSPDEYTEDRTSFKSFKPPDMTSRFWKRKMRRAWVELVIWYDFHRWGTRHEPLNPVLFKSNIPFFPRKVSATRYVADAFGHQEIYEGTSRPNAVSLDVIEAHKELGSHEQDSDKVIDACYTANTLERSFVSQISFFHALCTIVHGYRKDSEILHTRLAIEKSKGLFSMDELKRAYEDLGIDIDTLQQASQLDNSVILELYRSTCTAHAANLAKQESLKESLAIISNSRGRPAIFEEAKQLIFELDLNSAYKILEVQAETEDDFIASAYHLAASESRFSPDECIEALRIIGESRKSSELLKLYRSISGHEDAWQVPAPDIPAGLNNIGNTCYLNSVLQYFFAIRPLRERVLQAGRKNDEKEYRINPSYGCGRKLTEKEWQRSHRFVAQLSQLYAAMISSPISALTPERELAYMALVSPRWEDEGDRSDAEKPTNNNIFNEGSPLVREPANMSPESQAQVDPFDKTSAAEKSSQKSSEHDQIGSAPPLPPRAHAKNEERYNQEKLRRNSLMQLGAQQDVSECLDNVMFQVEAALTSNEVVEHSEGAQTDMGESFEDSDWVPDGDLLKRLFLGRTCQRVEVQDTQLKRGTSVHLKREVFKILPIDVHEEGQDIYDGLDGFFDEETLEGPEGKPMCRTVTLTDPPALLQIQLQRVQFDRIRGAFKSQAHLNISETIFMDRYLDFDPQDKQDGVRLEKRRRTRELRRRGAELRIRIKELRQGPTSNVSQTLSKTASFLKDMQNLKNYQSTSVKPAEETFEVTKESSDFISDESLTHFLNEEASHVESEITSLEAEIASLKNEVESLWDDERRVEYTLASVFMHRGEASHGHYFLNQRKLEGRRGTDRSQLEEAAQPSTWFKYNDDVVQEVPLSQVLRDSTNATPYLVSFVRKDIQEEVGLFDTVCRDIYHESTNNISSVPKEFTTNQASGEGDIVMQDITQGQKGVSTGSIQHPALKDDDTMKTP